MFVGTNVSFRFFVLVILLVWFFGLSNLHNICSFFCHLPLLLLLFVKNRWLRKMIYGSVD